MEKRLSSRSFHISSYLDKRAMAVLKDFDEDFGYVIESHPIPDFPPKLVSLERRSAAQRRQRCSGAGSAHSLLHSSPFCLSL